LYLYSGIVVTTGFLYCLVIIQLFCFSCLVFIWDTQCSSADAVLLLRSNFDILWLVLPLDIHFLLICYLILLFNTGPIIVRVTGTLVRGDPFMTSSRRGVRLRWTRVDGRGVSSM